MSKPPMSPFSDAQVVQALYKDSARLGARTGALHDAKIQGSDATIEVANLAERYFDTSGATIADIGCGRGSTTIELARRMGSTRLVAVDNSAALLETVTARTKGLGLDVSVLLADFHELPFERGSLNGAVAAFCIYHSPDPRAAIREISRCLKIGGHLVVATKSVTSYAELDEWVAEAGLDVEAQSRISLYQSFNSENANSIMTQELNVLRVEHHEHVFEFHGPDHLARYLATSPKYRLPAPIAGDLEKIAGVLRQSDRREPYRMTSTVSYIVARR